jgi:transposase
MLITLVLWPPRRRSNRTGSRTAPKPFLNDSQWFLIADLFPDPPVSRKGGRPRVKPRPCLEGILWVLRSGARWKDLPERYPSFPTCWRRLRDWVDAGIFLVAWQRLLCKLDGLRKLNWEEAIGDGTFSPAKRGAPRLAILSAAREPSRC